MGSLVSYIPALIAAAAMILRTALEDRTLQAELPGYQAYARLVRYRLIPGVW
jgi:protein-S-isoprenylcysteine O-methyltransferase Ste14